MVSVGPKKEWKVGALGDKAAKRRPVEVKWEGRSESWRQSAFAGQGVHPTYIRLILDYKATIVLLANL